jgi:hypothetical protein
VHFTRSTVIAGLILIAMTSRRHSGTHALFSDTHSIIHISPGIPTDPDFRLAKYVIGAFSPSFSGCECTNTIFWSAGDGSCHADLFEELFKGITVYPLVLLTANQVD